LTPKTDFLTKKQTWIFTEQEMKLDWIANPEERHRTRQNIDYKGVFTQALVDETILELDDDIAELNIQIKSYESKAMEKAKEKASAPKGNLFSRLAKENPLKE